MQRDIYLASSWRNELYDPTLQALRLAGHKVYNFRAPNDREGPFPVERLKPDVGFNWRDIDPDWENWSVSRYRRELRANPIARNGYKRDMEAMEWANTFVMLLPCGRSAHLEAGWACGWRDNYRAFNEGGGPSNKEVYALIPGQIEPELMYGMLDGIFGDVDGLLAEFEQRGRL